jgi:hypothetical protein
MSSNMLTRGAVTAYARALRLPFDAGNRLLGREPEEGRRAAAGLAVDQLEASFLAGAGRLFGDSELQAEAQLRATAVQERREALRLRERAAEVSDDADERVTRKEQLAELRRAKAGEEAQRRSKRAAKTEQSRQRVSARAAAAQREAIDRGAKAERLEALDAKADALAEKEEALTAKAEARRLGEAAARTKAQRNRKATANRAAR